MSKKSFTRRDFLKATGITLGASTVICTGLGYIATHTIGLDTPGFVFGEENTDNKRVLVVYATRAGSTVEVAATIGEVLGARGFAVDVQSVKENPKVDGYQAVIIGSAVRMGKILPEAIEFAEKQRAALQDISTAYFTVCLTMKEDTPDNRKTTEAYLEPLRQIKESITIGLFGGKIDYDTLEPALRLALSQSESTDFPEGDWRDWDKIRGWAETISA